MNKQLKADLSLLFITAIWGASFSLMKNVLDYMSSFAYLSLRFITASLVLIIVFHKKLRHINKKLVLYGSILGVMLFSGMALQVSGLYYTTASNSAFITGMNVIMVPIISVALLKKKPDINSVIGVILASGGLFFLTGGMNFRFNKGDFLTFLCAICFAFQIILIDKYSREFAPELLVIAEIVFVALLNTCVWLFIDFKPVILNAPAIFILLITGVLGTALAFGVQVFAQRHTTPTHTALILAVEPMFGAFFAMIIPNSQGEVEMMTRNAVIGCMLILAGMLACEIKPLRSKGF